jgi:hypothetical protein
VCSNHPHLADGGTLLDVTSNDDPDDAERSRITAR